MRALFKRGLGGTPHGHDRTQETGRAEKGDADHGNRFCGLRARHFRGLAPQRLRVQGNGFPRRTRNRAYGFRNCRMGGRHFHLRFFPESRAFGLFRTAEFRLVRKRLAQDEGKRAGDMDSHYHPRVSLRPVRRLQSASA